MDFSITWVDWLLLAIIAMLLAANWYGMVQHQREKQIHLRDEVALQNAIHVYQDDNDELEKVAKLAIVLAKYSDRSVASFYGADSPQAKEEAALARAFEVERNEAISQLRSMLIKRYGRQALEH